MMKMKQVLIIFTIALMINFSNLYGAFSLDKEQDMPVYNILPVINADYVPQKVYYNKVYTPIPSPAITNYSENYEGIYSKVYLATLLSFSQRKALIQSFNSAKGEMKVKLATGKVLNVKLKPIKPQLVQVKAVPVDGIYNVSDINRIFDSIKIELRISLRK